MAKDKKPSTFSKLDVRYWRQKLFRNSFTHEGRRCETSNWCVRIARSGRRETFNLGTADKDDAAKKACQIYNSIVSKDWEETLQTFKPRSPKPQHPDQPGAADEATIGNLIRVSTELSRARIESKAVYAKALRKIVADVFQIPNGRKYDGVKGGREAWAGKVDSIILAELTPEKVGEWQRKFMANARNPIQRKRAAVTVNSLLRNAKALFSKKIRKELGAKIELPCPLPFDELQREVEPSLRYRSEIDAGTLLKNAKCGLAPADPEAYKLLLMTLVLGLRRSEADRLPWHQFDFEKLVLKIDHHEDMALKSEDSVGDIGIDPEVCAIFKDFKENTKSHFVLEAPARTRVNSVSDQKPRRYRCEGTHKDLLSWLRAQGVRGLRPIHTMRKEIGSIIASRDGIWKASRYLRHSDIRITNELYSDAKTPIVAGLGANLS